jgi:hypothetical protein
LLLRIPAQQFFFLSGTFAGGASLLVALVSFRQSAFLRHDEACGAAPLNT